ncbi:alpha/beta hydrolase [Pedobacter frigiditerrae]|uniref:Alpha/beta hydrolase n=1 Tax=Pedobacter frigiditerrae TaxID=2530452 RepID=A0A4R0N1A4_9SPHI|nr:alpha/beta hydrolase [Pedobacter frigiditerrae]TCC93568.1 alpha/beta hydrolase [Pedobacter frigiditerrae]
MVYFISGLGADERVFQFLDLSKIEHRFIKWNKPRKNESLFNYCQELTEQIDKTKEVILIGISFGGIIAQEILKILACKKVIIISSVKSKSEFSWQLKLASRLQIHKIAPLWLLTLSNLLTADYYFDTKSKEESKLLHQIIKDTNPNFLVWAIHQIMNWDNDKHSENLIHIHGTSDKIFPIKNIQNAIEIPNGGHFMIVNKASQIERLIFDSIK